MKEQRNNKQKAVFEFQWDLASSSTSAASTNVGEKWENKKRNHLDLSSHLFLSVLLNSKTFMHEDRREIRKKLSDKFLKVICS